MDHLLTTISGRSISVPWWVVGVNVAIFVIAIICFARFKSAGWAFIAMFVTPSMIYLPLFNIPVTTNDKPDVTTVAHRLGLRDMPGQGYDIDDSTKTFLDKDGSRYSQCYVETTKIDAHHMSSRLLCANNGKNVVVHRQS